jgi:hypothetical protein
MKSVSFSLEYIKNNNEFGAFFSAFLSVSVIPKLG